MTFRVVGVLASLVLVLTGCSGAGARAARPDRLPAVTLAALEGHGSVDLSTLRGPLVINLWASWCGPCRKELPQYQAFAQKYAGKVAVLGVDFQETRPAAARQLAHDTGVAYPLFTDPDGRLRAAALPKVILVDKSGKIVHEKYAEITSVGQLEALVHDHLGVTT